MARVLDWQSRGRGFEPHLLHKVLRNQDFFFLDMFYVYIIYSELLNKYYVGSCQNIDERLRDHLNSRSKYTKSAKDWKLKYSESFFSRSEAYQREMQIKKMKSRTYIEKLIENSH